MTVWAGVDDPITLDFKCTTLDAMCNIQETLGNGMASATGWIAEAALGGQDLSPGSTLWNAAIDQAGMWLGLSVVVMFITATVGIAGGAIMGRGDIVKRTMIGTLLSFPATMFAYFIVGKGLAVVDDLSDGLLARITGNDGGFGALITAMLSGTSGWAALESLTNPAAQIGRVLLVLVGLFIGVLFIMVAMAFRNFVLMLLIAFAPLAFVLLPAKGGGVWVKRWVSAITAMALARPLILGTLALVFAGLQSAGSIWTPAGLSLMIGFGIAAFMPLMAYSFFQFIGGGEGGDQVGQRAAGTVNQLGQQGRMAVQRRQGQTGRAGLGGQAGQAGQTPKPGQNQTGGASTPSGGSAKPGGGVPGAQTPGAGRPGAGPGAGTALPSTGSGGGTPSSVPKPAPKIPRGPSK